MKHQNPDSTATPPEVIEHKGRIAKIYRAKNRDRYRYEVKYRDPDGEWKRETFDEHEAARKHAGLIVRKTDKSKPAPTAAPDGEWIDVSESEVAKLFDDLKSAYWNRATQELQPVYFHDDVPT